MITVVGTRGCARCTFKCACAAAAKEKMTWLLARGFSVEVVR